MTQRWQLVLMLGVLTIGSACTKTKTGTSTTTTPTTPTTPTPTPTPTPTTPANRNPTITSLTVTPTLGVSGLTTISMSATATDPDNDAVTYQWSFSGTIASGASTSAKLTGDGNVVVQLTVSDGKGGTATDSRTVTIGTLSGTWSFVANDCGVQSRDKPIVMSLTQTGGTVNGTFSLPGSFCNGTAGQTGKLDPGAPGTIDDRGNFNARLKIGDFLDFFLTGKMDSTGRKVTGKPNGSGFGGSTDTFTMTKQ